MRVRAKYILAAGARVRVPRGVRLPFLVAPGSGPTRGGTVTAGLGSGFFGIVWDPDGALSGSGYGIAIDAGQTYDVWNVVLEPITAYNYPGVIYNPAGIGCGSYAGFRAEVYPESIQDSDITWSVAEGNCVGIVGSPHGRAVSVLAGQTEGNFKLELDVAGLSLNPKPHIYGCVKEWTNTPLHFYVITSNGVPAVTTNTVQQWVNAANNIYKQCAMHFSIAEIKFLENKVLFYLSDSDAFYEICSYTNCVGGLEVYCVAKLFDDYVAGLCSDSCLPYGSPQKGIAIRSDAKLNVLSHEIGHACLLHDLDRTASSELISEELLGCTNWSGGMGVGYYRSNYKYDDLLSCMLMYEYTLGINTDIPFYSLKNYFENIGFTEVQSSLPQMDRNPQD